MGTDFRPHEETCKYYSLGGNNLFGRLSSYMIETKREVCPLLGKTKMEEMGMEGRFRRQFLLSVAIICCTLVSFGAVALDSAVSASPSQCTLEYQLPCLTVYADGSHGHISRLPLKFTRTGDDKPLRILIGDDTPGGSGETIRNSVWLAAVTAAMLRNDTMHGVTITLEFSGNIDGPSAGGVTCLAILSALDGRPLPNDFAMTGTILPDGTIGVVGGIPEKMRAAARSGVRRIFIPAFLRIFKDEKGNDIDLNRLAKELKIELHRVTNISEAYAILHHQPYSSDGYVNVREMTKLPTATEDVLVTHYKELLEKVKEKCRENPELEEVVISSSYRLSPAFAERFYQEGKLLPATNLLFHTLQAWLAWEKTIAFTESFNKKHNPDWTRIRYLQEYHHRKILSAFREAVDKHVKTCEMERDRLKAEHLKKMYPDWEAQEGYFPFRKGQSEITAQLEPVCDMAFLTGGVRRIELCRPDDKTFCRSSAKELKQYWDNEFWMLTYQYLRLQDSRGFEDFLGELGDTLPRLRPNKRASEVERLFFSAAHAVEFAAGENLQTVLNAQAGGTSAPALNPVKQDPLLLPFWMIRLYADELHQALLPDSERKLSARDYHLQVSLKAQVETFTMASALLVNYGADRSNDFIPHLLRNARESAVRNINECVKAGIPCLSAVCDFEIAEANDGTPIDRLIPYWRASLYSKALLMSFQPENDGGQAK